MKSIQIKIQINLLNKLEYDRSDLKM